MSKQKSFLPQFTRTTLRTAALILLSIAPTAAFSIGPVVEAKKGEVVVYDYFYPEDPCTDQEVWDFGKTVPNYWKVRFAKPFKDPKATIDYLLLAQSMKISAKTDEIRSFAQYWVGRSYYKLKLFHLAYLTFAEVLAQEDTASTRGSRLGALECVNQLEKTYTAFQLPKESIAAISLIPYQTLNKTSFGNYQDVLTRNIRKRISLNSSDQVSIDGMSKLPKNSSHRALLEMLAATGHGNDAQVISNADLFLKNIDKAETLKHMEDLVYLMKAQALYNLSKYKLSAEEFVKLKNNSNYFVQSLIGSAWANLMSKNYEKATSSAYNFFSGPLRKTFSPDSNTVVSIAFTETCNFPEAIESLDIFKKAFSKSHRWLFSWQSKQKANPQNMYKMTIDYLNKKIAVPEKVGNEWVRSPIFISGQEELNLILEQRPLFDDLTAKISKKSFGDKKEKIWKQAAADTLSNIKKARNSLEAKERNILKLINQDITERTKVMIKTLAESLENAKRIEAEVYSALGESMIVEQAMGNDPKKEKNKKKEGHKYDSSVWDWGQFPSQAFEENEDQVEIWSDEIGFLKTDLTNHCAKK